MTPAEIYRELGQDGRAEMARSINRDDAALRYSYLSRYRRIPQFGDFRQMAKKVAQR